MESYYLFKIFVIIEKNLHFPLRLISHTRFKYLIFEIWKPLSVLNSALWPIGFITCVLLYSACIECEWVFMCTKFESWFYFIFVTNSVGGESPRKLLAYNQKILIELIVPRQTKHFICNKFAASFNLCAFNISNCMHVFSCNFKLILSSLFRILVRVFTYLIWLKYFNIVEFMIREYRWHSVHIDLCIPIKLWRGLL